MKLIKPSYEVVNEEDFHKATRAIERAARKCYKSEDKIGDGSDTTMVKKLIDMGHEAMLEFGPSITVEFTCDRGVSHELVRHRLCSFAQESTRYCNYSNDKFDNQVTFIIPCWFTSNLVGSFDDVAITEDKAEITWMYAMLNAELLYIKLLELGWTPQQARSVLPNSLKTEISVKANIREWRHIFIQRTSKKAHPQMRELMIPLLKHFQLFAPALFNDIEVV